MPVTDIDFSEVSIKGINYSDVGYSLTVNGTEGEMFNRNIISLNTQINFREGTELVLPEGFITPVCRAGTSEEQMHDQYIENRGYDGKSVFLYQENIVDFTFKLPEYLDVDTMAVKVHPVYHEHEFYEIRNMNHSVQPMQGVNYYIFDTLDETYVELDTLDETTEVARERFAGDGELTVRIVMDGPEDINSKEYGKALYIPELSLQGRAN